MGAEWLLQLRDVEGYQEYVWPMKSRWLDRSKRVIRTSVNCCWQYLKDFKAGWDMYRETVFKIGPWPRRYITVCMTVEQVILMLTI